MPTSFAAGATPVFLRGLTALLANLEKGEAFAAARKLDEGHVLSMRLYPDMYPLTRQVQICCDSAKNGLARLAGVEPRKFEDHETTFAQLKARITDTIAYIHTLDGAAIEAGADRDVVLTLGGQPVTMKGAVFLNHFSLPNFYFHHAVAYSLLRHIGVELGKRDFIGGRPTA